jgi:hypothetical protein
MRGSSPNCWPLTFCRRCGCQTIGGVHLHTEGSRELGEQSHPGVQLAGAVVAVHHGHQVPGGRGDQVKLAVDHRDGRICRLRIFVDMLGVSRQLGLMPPVGGRTERAMAGAQRATTKLRQAIRRGSGR